MKQNASHRKLIEGLGARYLGTADRHCWVETAYTTIAIPVDGLTEDAVREVIRESCDRWGRALTAEQSDLLLKAEVLAAKTVGEIDAAISEWCRRRALREHPRE